MKEAFEANIEYAVSDAVEETTRRVTEEVTKEVAEETILEIAKKMKDENIDIEFISKVTGLTKEQIDLL